MAHRTARVNLVTAQHQRHHRNAYLDGSRTVDLRNNCIDLNSADPFIIDVLERGERMLLEPQRDDCAG